MGTDHRIAFPIQGIRQVLFDAVSQRLGRPIFGENLL
jgi:hypothetical protein